ncbi:hypothetical protein GCM10023321_31290 [Pseudonocardia eucalypti]|uniref:Uncharacterized protein n=1 Tax=Pseudonocardia eucalypti TaxID=648755 RepID=A0ABP9Q2R8_9PSEU|nr:hypothetical protein [Pseudonocardia eucalypti]
MLIPFDDYPVHQTALPLAQSGGGNPDHYDRFWFNGYTEDFYFAVALGSYPNRGVIDGAFAVVHRGEQRSVFASGRAPVDRARTEVGPIRIEIVEPMRVNRVRVSAPEHGLEADLTFRSRTPAHEEPRQTRYAGARLNMDVTRATSLGSWTGEIKVDGEPVALPDTWFGTKDRSWGVRPVGLPAPAAPEPSAAQFFFLWAPLNFDDCALHYMVFEDAEGVPWAETGARLPLIGPDDPVTDASGVRELAARHAIRWAPGTRRAASAALRLAGDDDPVQLEPLLTFRMRGAGYFHPTWGHGLWHGEAVTGAERHRVEELDKLAPDHVHIQQVVRARWGGRTGMGVLEQIVIGPHAPSGFTEFLDGAPER